MSDESTRDEGEASAFEQAKAEAREKYAGRDLKGLAMEMQEWGRRREECKQDLARINGFYDVLRFELIPTKMDNDGVENVRYDFGQVVLTPDLLVSTKPGQKEGLFGWLRKNKLSALIQPSINSSTLKAFVKDRMRKAKPIPEEFLNVTPVTRASIRKPQG